MSTDDVLDQIAAAVADRDVGPDAMRAGGPELTWPTVTNADLLDFANTMRQTYVALTQEGFTEQQALIIIGQIIASNTIGGWG